MSAHLENQSLEEQWHQFVGFLRDHVPAIPANATAAYEVSRHGALDHSQRTALRQLVRLCQEHVSPMALDSACNLGDVWQLLGEAVPEGAWLVRGDYRTANVRLRAIRPDELPVVYEAALDPNSNFRWRFRGRTPSPEEFHAAMFAGVLAQFIVESATTQAPIGIVSAYDERLEAGHCVVAFQRIAGPRGSEDETTLEGLALFIEYLFTTFPLKRVFAEIPEYNVPLLAGSLDSLGVLEGRLTDYHWYNGASWDQCIFAITRERWDAYSRRWFREDVRMAKRPREESQNVERSVKHFAKEDF